jgi:hypothetical protein
VLPQNTPLFRFVTTGNVNEFRHLLPNRVIGMSTYRHKNDARWRAINRTGSILVG